jgi:HD-GYP domain-containing protein (c-di-GMP phosphodiesterase class II)
MYSRLNAQSDVQIVAAAAADRLEQSLYARDASEAAAAVEAMIAALKPHLPSEGIQPYVEELVSKPLQLVDYELLSELLVTLAQPFARLHLGDTSQGLWSLMALRDPQVAAHTSAVTSIVRRLGNALDLETGQFDRLLRAAKIFDIGKLLVPTELLHGAFELSNETWPRLKLHAEAGAEIVKKIPQIWTLAEIVRSHHERFDGFGYPDGMKGQSIPLEARIIAVADAWHAMISPRPYRHPAPIHEAMQMIGDGRGTQWDPQIADALLMLVWSDRPQIGSSVLRARYSA